MSAKGLTGKEAHKARKIIDELGGVEKIRSGLMSFTERVERMERIRAGLIKKHPDKWVAMAGGEIVAIADSLDDILRELDERGISRAEAVVEFLDTRPRNMIL